MHSIGPSDIDPVVLARVVARMPEEFATKDVSEDPDMLQAHPAGNGAWNWHQAVGKALSAQRVDLGIDEIKKGTRRGSRWHHKIRPLLAQTEDQTAPSTLGAVQVPEVRPGVPGLTTADLGPQYSRDKPFTRRMRKHQSWWRAHILGVPWGTGPKPNEQRELGSMLRREDGQRGLNFLTSGIHATAMARLAEGQGAVEPYRLLHNLLSSQPMCFNLFGPLVTDLRLATVLVGALLPGEVTEVLAVHLEYAPMPASDHLGDATAFDAFIIYRQPDGRSAFLGIETKLTEPFSQNKYNGPAYRRWMEGSAVWGPEATDQVAVIKHNQLWRDHLLAVSMLQQPGVLWATGRLALVRHPLDHHCADIAKGYKTLLQGTDDTFRDWTLDDVVDAWASVVGDENQAWLDAFRLRYLDLKASE